VENLLIYMNRLHSVTSIRTRSFFDSKLIIKIV